MEGFLGELTQALRYAGESDPFTILLPLAVVAVIQGLVTDGPFEAGARALTGLFWFAVVVFAFGGLRMTDRFELSAWSMRLEAGLDELSAITLLETLGFYLLMLAGIIIVTLVRSV
ncbi:MAG: hypothetical protein AAF830_01550, partial [Pseudomonadota bacterium]